MSFTPSPEFGSFIKDFRTSQGLSVKEAAKLADIGSSTLERWEKGKVDTIQYGTLKAFATGLFKLEVEDFLKALRAYEQSVASDTVQAVSPPNTDEIVTPILSDTTELIAPSPIEQQPVTRGSLFGVIRRKRARYYTIISVGLVVLTGLALILPSWLQSNIGNSVSIAGEIACMGNKPIVGIWIQATNGRSGWAEKYKNKSDVSKAAFRYDLHMGSAYNLHVGCGGTKEYWVKSYNTETGSGTVRDYKFHFFTCQDIPLLVDLGSCNLTY